MRVSDHVSSCSRTLLAVLLTILAGRAFAAETTCVLVKTTAVRATPTQTGEVLATAPAGMSLQVQAPQNGWAKITSPGAAYGAFIPAAACGLTTPEPPNANPPQTQPTVSISAPPALPPSVPPVATPPRPSTAARHDGDPQAQPGTQQVQAAAPAGIAVAQEPKPLTNEDILGLVKVGLGSALITTKIAGSPCRFDTSPAALQQLKAAGVPDDVLMAMLQASASASPSPRARVKDEMTSNFQRLQNTVLTVWSATGHGTGFVVDPKGLILTNHHVVGPSDYIAVQFDPTRKISAILLEADPLKDVAVIWADLAAFPEAMAAPIATSTPPVEEGERVFTIGSPLNQRKILTTGVASKVEARAILSDVNINPGNSGGPLFNSLGEVVGITTFGDPTTRGPGVSGIVRIEEALPLLERARAAASGRTPPEAVLLPVEPAEPFPIEAIKAAAQAEKLDLKPYTFGAGDYDVGVLTPIVLYRADDGQREAVKSKEKRTKQKDEAFDPTANLYNWAEYAGEYRAVITVRATPKLRETFWSSFGRGLAAAGGSHYTGAATLKFKTDFMRMELLCGSKPVMPIHPGKIAHVIDVRNPYVKATDATYEGLYTYPASAFSPDCGQVVLRLFSEKKPQEATVKVLDKKTVDRVWMDFGTWRQRATP